MTNFHKLGEKEVFVRGGGSRKMVVSTESRWQGREVVRTRGCCGCRIGLIDVWREAKLHHCMSDRTGEWLTLDEEEAKRGSW